MGNSSLKRKIRHLAGSVLIGLVGMMWLTSANAGTVTFDDLGTSYNGTSIPGSYAGLNWNNFDYLTATVYSPDPSGYQHGMVSSPNVAFNGFGNSASFSSASTFTFNSAYFTGAWNDGLTINVTGSYNGTQLYSTSFMVDSNNPSYEVFNWSNIDKVLFSSTGGTNAGYGGSGTQFVMDSLAVNVHAVPEPPDFGIMVLGLGMIGLLAWRRRRSLA